MNRPNVLNALCHQLMSEVNNALDNFEGDTNIGAIVITGNDKAFAAGADIKEMLNANYAECIKRKPLSFDRISNLSKPIIAAVNGYAVSFRFVTKTFVMKPE